MYYSQSFSTTAQDLPNQMTAILKAINDKGGILESITHSSAETEGD